MSETPISIISGYLGSGKTTLIKKLIEDLDRDFAILMNEFGEVNIDSKVLEGDNIRMSEVAEGCVCCSMLGEFRDAVSEIIDEYNPELIVVETTGVAEPDSLISDINNHIDECTLDSVITVVDSVSLRSFERLGRTGVIQLETADIILLNKTDLIEDNDEISDLKNKIREYNENSPIIQSEYCDVDIGLLFDIEASHYVEHVHDEERSDFDSFSYDVDNRLFKEERLRNILVDLPDSVYRLKGYLKIEDKGSCLLNYVSGRWSIEESEDVDEYSLVFIGRDLSSDEDYIRSVFDNLG